MFVVDENTDSCRRMLTSDRREMQMNNKEIQTPASKHELAGSGSTLCFKKKEKELRLKQKLRYLRYA